MASKYHNSMPFDIDLQTYDNDFELIQKPVDDVIMTEVTVRETFRHKYSNHLRLILLNLLKAYRQNSSRYVAVFMDRNHYYPQKEGKQGLKISYQYFRKVILLLEKHEYIELKKGYYFKQVCDGMPARIRATQKLQELFSKAKNIYREMNPIILKHQEGSRIAYKETQETNRMRENINIINGNLQRHFIGLYVPDSHHEEIQKKLQKKNKYNGLDLSKVTLSRTFIRGSFEYGGRFHGGWWINLAKEYRRFIRIDDIETEERDFTSTCINLIYLYNGLKPCDDAYFLPEVKHPMTGEIMHKQGRDLMKAIVNAMINNNSRQSALSAVQAQLNFGGCIHVSLSAKEIVERLEEKHLPIKDFFYVDFGFRLFRLESDIAEGIMLRLAAKDIAALPIHDGFLAKKTDIKELEKAMIEEVTSKFGRPLPFKGGELSNTEFLPSTGEAAYSLYHQEWDRWFKQQEERIAA